MTVPYVNASKEKRTPIVSIGLPVYNGAEFLAEAVDSILAQEFGDFELIISDNASTDETPEICSHYAAQDSRVTYVRQPENLGAAKNYNHVFHRSSAEYFKWAAHDDLLKPQFLSRCVATFRTFEKPPAIVYPLAQFIDEAGQILRAERNSMHTTSSSPSVRVYNAIQGSGGMVTAVFGVFHRETLARTRLIGSFIAFDYVLLLECALLGSIIHLGGEPQFQRRIHKQMSRQANRTDKEVMRWFDPAATKTGLSSRQRLNLEFVKSIYRIEGLSGLERHLCTASLFSSLLLRRTRVTAGLWRRKLLDGSVKRQA